MVASSDRESAQLAAVRRQVAEYIKSGQLQLAQMACDNSGTAPDSSVIASVREALQRQADSLKNAGEIRAHRRLNRRLRALAVFHDHGFNPDWMVPEVILPEDYEGKILLISVTGDGFEPLVCLRSGDIWHREILRDAREEIIDLGFSNALVDPLGGAHVGINRNQAIVLWGGSQELGECDKQFASKLIQDAFPSKLVIVDSQNV